MKNCSSSSEYADLIVFNHSCSWLESGIVTVMCLAQEHENIIEPGRESSDMCWLQCPHQRGTTILNRSNETSFSPFIKLYMVRLLGLCICFFHWRETCAEVTSILALKLFFKKATNLHRGGLLWLFYERVPMGWWYLWLTIEILAILPLTVNNFHYYTVNLL